MNYKWRARRPSTWKGIVAGLAGGLAGAWVMNQFQKGSSKASEVISSRLSDGQKQSMTQKRAADGAAATTIAADRIMRPILGRRLRRDEKKIAGPIMHYAFASALGSAYGATAEYLPAVRMVCGIPYGAAVFAGADELAVPALKLSRGPSEYPISKHLNALSSHVVFGLTSELVRRGIRRVLGS